MRGTQLARVSRARSLHGDLACDLERVVALQRASHYPLSQWQNDPVGYVHKRLRVELDVEVYKEKIARGEDAEIMMPHQAAILRALADGIAQLPIAIAAHPEQFAPDRVAVRSGQKSGKTKTAIWAALWFYECFAGARVFLCAAIEEQTKLVLWRELTVTLERARRLGSDIDGELAKSPSGGLVSTDALREIKGISGREIEAVAGLSGRQLTIIDEASHLPQKKAEVFDGNAMGGGAQLWISNPTRNAGPFFESFHSQKRFWSLFHVDGEKVVAWKAANDVEIPFTVSRQKVAEAREKYGEQSAFWALRVKGEFLRNETGRAIAMATIEEALARWPAASAEGRLVVGYDPAGAGDGGDRHAVAAVRGVKCLAIEHSRGPWAKSREEEDAARWAVAFLDLHMKDNEHAALHVDAEGPIGSAIYGLIRAESLRRRHDPADKHRRFEAYAIRSSSKHVREKDKFERVRDEMIWVLGEWMHTGAIPANLDLEQELYAPVWTSDANNKLHSTPKSKIRDELGRSPDLFDALALAVRAPGSRTDEDDAPPKPAPRDQIEANDWAWRDRAEEAPAAPTTGEPWWPNERREAA